MLNDIKNNLASCQGNVSNFHLVSKVLKRLKQN